MVAPFPKQTGTRYTASVAWLGLAFVFSPLALLITRPLDYVAVLTAVAGSAVAATFVMVEWLRYPETCIPAIGVRYLRSM
jgi:hypothetical protein